MKKNPPNNLNTHRQLLEINCAAVILFEIESGEIIEFNSMAFSLFSEIESKNFYELINFPHSKISSYINTNSIKHSDSLIIEHKHTSDQIKYLEFHFNSFDKNFCYAIALDVSKREIKYQKVFESEQNYRNIVENVRDIIYTHDLNGNFISVNKAVEVILGYTKDEALQMNLLQLIEPSEVVEVKEHMRARMSGEKATMASVKCVSKTGEIIVFEFNSHVLWKDSQPIAFQGVARDITSRQKIENALQESEEKYRDLFENAHDLVYTHDLEGNFISINHTIKQISGYEHAEIMGKNIKDLIKPSYLPLIMQKMEEKLNGKKSSTYEVECISKFGMTLFLEVYSRLIYKDGKPCAVQGIARDVTQRKWAEQSLKASEEKYRKLFENANDIVFTLNFQGKLTSVNRAAELVTGYTIQEILSMNMYNFVSPAQHKILQENYYNLIKKGALPPHELDFITKDGRTITVELSSQVIIENGKHVGFQGIARDISERKIAEEKLKYSALYDSLTDLPNRASFIEHLQKSIDKRQKDNKFCFAVLFFDLDRFKVINDSLGHIAGDNLLISIANTLKSSLRQGDFVARFGGDEFTVLLNDVRSEKYIIKTVERIQNEISGLINIDNYEIFCSASIGIAISDDEKWLPDDYLRDADTAMYHAKTNGKARYEIFDKKMHLKNLELLQVETDLRRGIARNEITVFFQPLISLKTGEICDFEALVRWNHPEKGLLTPYHFIKIAEETDLISSIGMIVLEKACRQTVEWQKKYSNYKNLSISVNLSAKEIIQPDLDKKVARILHQTNLCPSNLQLEVTESSVMENTKVALNIFTKLKENGVRLSTDDFGTGYSSLGYLHNYPFEQLKIDRSFISKIDTDQKTREIVRSIILLAHNLNIEVVAEGIETIEQLRELIKLDCDIAQGYLFNEPVNAEMAEDLLRNGLPNNIFEKVKYQLEDFPTPTVLELNGVPIG